LATALQCCCYWVCIGLLISNEHFH
jgi:hypothetical protein